MKLRSLLVVAGICGACVAAGGVLAQHEWVAPPRFARPEISTDEGGLWALMDREETRLRRSPFSIRSPVLHDYVQEVACKLAGEHCADVRVHLVHTPLFNASMAPNGMMQVWTGLMLRVDNEAQLAAVLGHEIGHYLSRHTLERLRDIKARSAFAQFIGLFGLVGAVAQLGVLASAFAYSLDQEREADRIGLILMRRAGYDPAEAPKVWRSLQLEMKANPAGDSSRTSPMFASHPAPEERQETLRKLAEAMPGGVSYEERWRENLRPFAHDWLDDEVKRGQYEESIALFTRMIASAPTRADILCARGDAYRARGKGEDLQAAQSDYEAAISVGGEPAETHRGLAAVLRKRNQLPAAKASFQRYLEMAPAAPDAAMIRSYIEEL